MRLPLGWFLKPMSTSDSSAPFEESYYLRVNPDVAAAVARGDFPSGRAHYNEFGRVEGRAASPPVLPQLNELVASSSTDTVFIELTTRCNLRCVYCAVSQPTYRGIDLALEGFDNFVEQMRTRRVRHINLNGHGETTIIRDWDAYADRLADAGFKLSITTNLAKRIRPEEVATLSRFKRILVSIDTVDGDLLARLRRGSNLDRILENIKLVLDFAAQRGRDPEIAVSCTVGDMTAAGVADLAETLLRHGVRVFRFGDLSEYGAIEGVLRMRHVSHLPAEARPAVREAFEVALERIAEAGGVAEVDASLRSWLDENTERSVHSDSRHAAAGDKTVWADEVGKGVTRDCLDPWKLAFVQSDAAVRPCCFFEEQLGTLATTELDRIVEGDGFRTLRKELLTGDLRPNCRNCQSRSLIDVERFQEKVTAQVER